MLTRAVLMALGGMPVCLAQTLSPPDAGTVLQQFPVAPPLPRPAEPPMLTRQSPAAPSDAPGPRVRVMDYEFSGNALVPGAQLRQALAEYTGREMGLGDLQRAAIAAMEVYSRAGLLARVTLPPQDVTAGIVKLAVEEARFGRVRVQGGGPRFNAGLAEAIVAAQQSPGSPLKLDDLERALMLLNEVPGMAAQASLAAGTGRAETDLLLVPSDAPALSGEAMLDNHGSRSTGLARASLGLALHSPLGHGEGLQASFSGSEGTRFASVDASMPVGARGWRIAASTGFLRYRLTSEDFGPLRASGTSQAQALRLNVPMARSRRATAQLQLAVERKHFDNKANGSTASRYALHSTTLSLSGTLLDGLAGGGRNSLGLWCTRGRVVPQGPVDAGLNATIDVGAASGGSYDKCRYSLGRTQGLGTVWALAAMWTGQYSASNRLDSSEKFFLGGPQGLRAYPVNEAGGRRGDILTIELRASLADGFHAALFYDRGSVRISDDDASAPRGAKLRGAGVRVSWRQAPGPDVGVVLSRRLGASPLTTVQGRDQDGSSTPNRLWLQLLQPF